jgi:lysylphosphatidylglycerol synthetase-like protein (DUF2156 family)
VSTIKPEYKLGNPTPRADLFLNWGYILIVLGIIIALISVVFTAVIKGVNGKTLLIALIAFAIIAVVAFLMSRGAFEIPYQAGENSIPARRTVGSKWASTSSMLLLQSLSFQSCSLLSTRQLKSKNIHHGKKSSRNQFEFAG